MKNLIDDLRMIDSKIEMKALINKLEEAGINYNIKDLTNRFGEGRDMKLLELDGMYLNDIKFNIKYYFDMEFNSFHYSIEKDKRTMYQHKIKTIENNESMDEESKKREIEKLTNSLEYKRDQEVINNKVHNKVITKFNDYTLTLGLYFFDTNNRESLKKILQEEFGAAIKYDGHELWSSYRNRIELGPRILTYVGDIY